MTQRVVGNVMKTQTMRGEEDKWRTERRLERSKLDQRWTTTMDPGCNDNKARPEDLQTSLVVHQTNQEVHRISLVAHPTNQEVRNDNRARQGDRQINLEDLEVHQTSLEVHPINLEVHPIKEGLLRKRWILIQVILTTKHLPRKEKLPQKGNRLQKENHPRREKRVLQTEQGLAKTQFNLFIGFTEHPSCT